MSNPPDPLASDPTPQPVIRSAAVLALVLFVLSKFALLSHHFNWWNPSTDDLQVIAEFVSDMFAAATVVVAWFVHNRVTPVATANKAIAEALATPVPADPIEEADAEFMKARMQQRAEADAALLAQAPKS